jgi:hypothetical protein
MIRMNPAGVLEAGVDPFGYRYGFRAARVW